MAGTMWSLVAGALVLVALAAAPAGAATIEVDRETDELNGDADCSLREAVEAANTNQPVSGCAKGHGGKRDVVDMPIEAFHNLTIGSNDDDANQGGDIDILDGGPITIKGAPPLRATGLIGPADDRIFDVRPGANARITLLELIDGEAPGLNSGGSIRATDAKLALDRVEIQSGAAVAGGGVAAGGSDIAISRSFLIQSEAVLGGGLYTHSGTVVDVERTRVLENVASGVAPDVRGGGILSEGGPLHLRNSTIADNDALSEEGSAVGGGIWSEAVLKVRSSLFEGNTAASDDAAEEEAGGAILADGDFGNLRTRAINSTFADNHVGEEGSGGAIYAADADMDVAHATFSGNTAGNGDHLATAGPPFLRVRNSLLPVDIFGSPCSDGVTSGGFNVSNATPVCGFGPKDKPLAGAGLDPDGLEDNGGPTQTIAITKTSPAKDLVPLRRCRPAQGVDQRGFRRPAGARCDSGAYERGAQP